MTTAPKRVQPLELAQWLREKDSVAVIDVRDDDYAGGAIKGHAHVPSAQFSSQVSKVIADNKDKDKIVFHCSLSQQRGPKAANMYQEARRLAGETGKGPQIYVLEGGFVQWQRELGTDADVTVNHDAEYWKEDHF